jgi:hypothetical protein
MAGWPRRRACQAGDEALLTEQDRAIMVDIIRQLIHEVDVSVRRTSAERLAEQRHARLDTGVAERTE